ncbi:hypothetical protein [Streptomyces sp. NPDC004579]|uniref:hypothetical protein n=1 Tax=Streptomyces sp. NPDC004579 TaxID=3154667 RepID=UPI0033A5D357
MSSTHEPRDEIPGADGPVPREGGEASPTVARLLLAVLVCTTLLLSVAVSTTAFRYALEHDSGSVGLNVFAYAEIFGVGALLYGGFVLLAAVGADRTATTPADAVTGCSFVLLLPVAVIGLGFPRLFGPVAAWGEALARWVL